MSIKNDPFDIPETPAKPDEASLLEAQRVDELAQWTPGSQQTSRKTHPRDVSDSPNAVPRPASSSTEDSKSGSTKEV